MVTPLAPTEYLYELRAIAENITRERCQVADVHKPQPTFHEEDVHHCEEQVTNVGTANTSADPSIPEASEAVRPLVEPESSHMANDPPLRRCRPCWTRMAHTYDSREDFARLA